MDVIYSTVGMYSERNVVLVLGWLLLFLDVVTQQHKAPPGSSAPASGCASATTYAHRPGKQRCETKSIWV